MRVVRRAEAEVRRVRKEESGLRCVRGMEGHGYGRVRSFSGPEMDMNRSRNVIEKTNRAVLKDLQTIPGVGPKTALDLYELGFRRVRDLAVADPEKMYCRLCRGGPVDRCMLYVFRCAVYFARETVHEPELLKWWNWTDEKQPAR
jgi:hypothetical protein